MLTNAQNKDAKTEMFIITALILCLCAYTMLCSTQAIADSFFLMKIHTLMLIMLTDADDG